MLIISCLLIHSLLSSNQIDLYGDELPDGAVARLGTIRYRYQEDVFSCALSPDGSRVAFGGFAGITVVDVGTGQPVSITSYDKPADSRESRVHRFIPALEFSGDGKRLAAIQGGRCRSWLMEGLKETPMNNTTNLRTIAFNNQNDLIGLYASGESLKLRNLDKGNEIASFRRGTSTTSWRHRLSRDGALLLRSTQLGSVREVTLWHVSSGKRLAQRSVPTVDAPFVAFTHAGTPVTAFSHSRRSGQWASGNHHLRFLNAKSGRIVQTTVEEDDRDKTREHEAICLGVSPDVDIFVTATFPNDYEINESIVRIRETSSGDEVLQVLMPKGLAGEAQISSDGRVVSVWKGGYSSWSGRSYHEFQSVYLLDLQSGKRIDTPVGHESPVSSIAFSPDGKVLASSSPDGSVRLWNISKAEQVAKLTDSQINGLGVVFSPDGHYISATARGKVVVWDAHSLTPVYWLPAPNKERSASISFSADGKRMAAGAIAYRGGYKFLVSRDARPRPFGTIEIWDVDEFHKYPFTRKAGRTTFEGDFHLRGALSKHRDSVLSLAFSQDGSVLVTGGWEDGGGLISFWRVPDGNLVRKIEHLDSVVGSIEYSPTGDVIAFAGSRRNHITRKKFGKEAARSVYLLNPSSGARIGTLAGHEGDVTAIAFSPDGKYLASSSTDRTVRLWEVDTRVLKKTFSGHRGDVLCLAFSPDGKLLASGSRDTTVLLWELQGR